MPTESGCKQGRRWSACHAARTGSVWLRVPASGAAAIGQRRVGVSMPTGSRCNLRFELVCISCNTITAVAACAARLAVAIQSRRVGAGNIRLREECALPPQYHHRGSCTSLDANRASSLVCVSCSPHRQFSVKSPRQRCCHNTITDEAACSISFL